MGIFRDDQPLPLHVPDLSRPAGATVGADGTVECVTCRARIPLAKADVVGLGYRCVPCSRQSELYELQHGAPDNSANLSGADRDGLLAAARRHALGGAAMIAVGIPLAMVIPRLGVAVVGGGCLMLVLAGVRRRTAK